MRYVIAKIVNLMQYVYTAWNVMWWNYHCGRARLHDAHMKRLDPEWREKM